MNNTLIAIYEALGRISTKGEDTILMAQVLGALGEYIQSMEQQPTPEISMVKPDDVD